jgi:hypothetical protein
MSKPKTIAVVDDLSTAGARNHQNDSRQPEALSGSHKVKNRNHSRQKHGGRN